MDYILFLYYFIGLLYSFYLHVKSNRKALSDIKNPFEYFVVGIMEYWVIPILYPIIIII